MSNQSTVNQLLRWAAKELEQSSDSAELDAKVLFRHVSQFSDTDLVIKADEPVEQDIVNSFRKTINKRLKGNPVAYLTGQREFWSLDFAVTPDTLIPRPETELLVEASLEQIPKDSIFDVADLGTGSGAIACAIAKERPSVKIIATDKSSAALEIARQNAQTLELNNIEFILSDWFKNLEGKKFNLILSNPPYISNGDKHLNQGDVRFEPKSALASGTDGLTDLRIIIKQAKDHLRPNGHLLVEHGYDQGGQVSDLFRQYYFKFIKTLKDLNGHDRVTVGR